MDNKKLLNFLFELGQLKRIKHEGWRMAGVEYPESVAEHSLRAAQIGYVLAKMENYKNPHEVCAMLVFHDIGECRVGDIHKVARRYVQANEEKAVKDQLKALGKMGDELLGLWKQAEYQRSSAGILAKDADLLETAITAGEYMEKGYQSAEDWIKNVSKKLQTKSARKLLKELKNVKSTDWWDGLKKI